MHVFSVLHTLLYISVFHEVAAQLLNSAYYPVLFQPPGRIIKVQKIFENPFMLSTNLFIVQEHLNFP